MYFLKFAKKLKVKLPYNLILRFEGKLIMISDIVNNEMKLTKKIASFLCSAQNELIVNISKMNFIEASRTAILASTKCYVENPNKKIKWIVENEAVKSMMDPFKLSNMEIQTKKVDKV